MSERKERGEEGDGERGGEEGKEKGGNQKKRVVRVERNL